MRRGLGDGGNETAMKMRKRLPYLLLAPSVIVLLALILYPLAFALRNSFWFWNLQTSPVPLYRSGLDNYRMVFQVTPFGVALKNTLLLGFLGTFAQFWFGMGIALLLHTHLRGMGFMRAVLIMPTTLAPVVAGFLFRYLLEPKGGLLPWLIVIIVSVIINLYLFFIYRKREW